MTRMATTGNILTAFDVTAHYRQLIEDQPDLSPPLAAIESLIALLATSPISTISETLSLLTDSTKTLLAAIPNPTPASAGTDLFTRYLITTLNRPSASNPTNDFSILRAQLLANSRLFVSRAKSARSKIAEQAAPLIQDGSTVLTNGASRVVFAALTQAAESGRDFRVIHVAPSSEREIIGSRESIRKLRELGILVAAIPDSAVAYVLATSVDTIIVGAETVVENGGIVSRLGTYQIGLLAKAMNKPFYVTTESYKFMRLYPLGQADLGTQQNIVDFKNESEVAGLKEASAGNLEHVDYTSPDLISALITENGILTPSAVSEELIKLWF